MTDCKTHDTKYCFHLEIRKMTPRYQIAIDMSCKDLIERESNRLNIPKGKFIEILIKHADIDAIEKAGYFQREKIAEDRAEARLINKLRDLSHEERLAILNIVEKQ